MIIAREGKTQVRLVVGKEGKWRNLISANKPIRKRQGRNENGSFEVGHLIPLRIESLKNFTFRKDIKYSNDIFLIFGFPNKNTK